MFIIQQTQVDPVSQEQSQDISVKAENKKNLLT